MSFAGFEMSRGNTQICGTRVKQKVSMLEQLEEQMLVLQVHALFQCMARHTAEYARVACQSEPCSESGCTWQ